MSTYVRDEDGKFIPASQRPDGTWRKARRVKDGYVPQEEVPKYESKGKQFSKKPELPVGMCPIMARAAQDKRLKTQQREAKSAASPAKKTNSHQPKNTSATSAAAVQSLSESMATIALKSEEDVQRLLKKLRKKIREIEAIEDKLKSGDLKSPEQDQLDKVARKADILRQIAELDPAPAL